MHAADYTFIWEPGLESLIYTFGLNTPLSILSKRHRRGRSRENICTSIYIYICRIEV